MDKTEFARFVKIVRSGYQKPEFLKDGDSLAFWYMMLQDLPYEIAMLALQKHIATSKWLPSVAEIRQAATEVTSSGVKDWSDEWAAVLHAVGAYGYMNESDALSTLSPLTREVVRQLGWKHICCCAQNEIMSLRANFRIIYTQKADREKELATLPKAVRETIRERKREAILDYVGIKYTE